MNPGRSTNKPPKYLGLPLVALTPTAQLVANRQEWLWFDPTAAVAIWQGPTWLHGFPTASLAGGIGARSARSGGVMGPAHRTADMSLVPDFVRDTNFVKPHRCFAVHFRATGDG